MERVLLSFINFENPSHNVNRLVGRTSRSETKLSRTDFVVKIVREPFLN